MAERPEPEVRTELMRVFRFNQLRGKFKTISAEAETALKNAKPTDMLAVRLSYDNPVSVLEAKVITADEFVMEAFS